VTPNLKIVDSAHAILRGDLSPPTESGMCLTLVRTVIEHALYGGRWTWYDRYRTHEATGKPPGRDPWSRDMERSLTLAGMSVATPRTGPVGDPTRYVDLGQYKPLPGDLLFRWDTAKDATSGQYIGHVAIAMHGLLMLENIDPDYRSPEVGAWRGPTRLTPLGAWPVTTIIRFNPGGSRGSL
jgi:hypothetical protein